MRMRTRMCTQKCALVLIHTSLLTHYIDTHYIDVHIQRYRYELHTHTYACARVYPHSSHRHVRKSTHVHIFAHTTRILSYTNMQSCAQDQFHIAWKSTPHSHTLKGGENKTSHTNPDLEKTKIKPVFPFIWSAGVEAGHPHGSSRKQLRRNR